MMKEEREITKYPKYDHLFLSVNQSMTVLSFIRSIEPHDITR